MIESELRQALSALNLAIANSDAPSITSSLGTIDGLLKAHRLEIDPQLRHYLKNRSYQKALAFLQGESDIPKGRCQGRTDFS